METLRTRPGRRGSGCAAHAGEAGCAAALQAVLTGGDTDRYKLSGGSARGSLPGDFMPTQDVQVAAPVHPALPWETPPDGM